MPGHLPPRDEPRAPSAAAVSHLVLLLSASQVSEQDRRHSDALAPAKAADSKEILRVRTRQAMGLHVRPATWLEPDLICGEVQNSMVQKNGWNQP